MSDLYVPYSNYKESKFETVKEKINHLRIDKNRVEELKKMQVEDYEGTRDFDLFDKVYKEIDVDQVVGFVTNRDVKNWYEALDSKVLHKPLTLRKYDPDNPGEFDMYLAEGDDLDPPSVVDVNGKFFVYSNGAHRLTIAKVLGGKKAKVIVYKDRMCH